MEKDVLASSRVDPRWLPGADVFWYRHELPESKHEYVLVDCLKKTRVAGLSSDGLAEEVKRITGEKLDIEAIEATTANQQDQSLPCDNKGLKGTFVYEEGPSPYAATEVSVQFINNSGSAITLEWLDHAADAIPRGTVEVGKSTKVTTWQGHLWRISTHEDGNILKLLYAAPKEKDSDVLVIDDDLMYDRDGARRPRSELGFPRVSVQDDSLWVTGEHGKTEEISTQTSGARAYDKDRVYISPGKQYAVVWEYIPEQKRTVYLVDSSPSEQLHPKVKAIQCLKSGDKVKMERPRLFDLNKREEIPTDDTLFRNPWSVTNVGWNKSGSEYRFLFNERGHQCLRIVGLGVDGQVRALLEERSTTFIDYSTKLFRHLTADDDEIIWSSERDGWNHLYLFDLARGTLKNQITTGDWLVRSVEKVDEGNRQIWFTSYGIVESQDPYYAQLVRINFDGSGLTVLTEGDGTHTWKWSPDHRWLIDCWSKVDDPPETVLRDGQTGAKILGLQESQMDRLIDERWNSAERFSTTGRDGASMIYGIIVRPSDFDASQTYPVLEEIYAGPHGYFTPKDFTDLSWLRRWADKGYVVVRIDGMGTNWRSKAFHDVAYKNLQDSGFRDRIKWITEAAATRPWMDLKRVGIRGVSAGGQSVGAALIHHGDFYKAGAADSGCHDNRMDKVWWSEQWLGWPVDQAYEDASNVLKADKLRGNLMLIVGDLDDNVDPSSTFQFANALNKAGKIYEMLIIPGGKHGCGMGEYGRMRQDDFFKRHLQDSESD